MGDSPPRENVFRAAYLPGAASVVDRAADGGPERVLTGHFAVFNKWTEINSMFEGNFMERIAPGTFKKTFKESAGIRVLFQHGRDPQVGDKPLGAIDSLREDDKGAAYEVNMFDTSYNRDLIPGLAAGVYGASFRFRVLREDLVMEPEASDDNPRALPERTIREAAVSEFGPVTFPAYADATAGLRSITDEMILNMYAAQEPERFARLISTFPAERIVSSDIVSSEQSRNEVDLTLDLAISPVKGAEVILTPETRRMADLRPLVITRNPNRERYKRDD